MKRYEITMTGRSPLIMHRDNLDFAERNVKAWTRIPENKALTQAGDDRTPAWTWIGYLYNDKNVVGLDADITIIAGIPMGIGSFLGAYFGGVFSSLIGVFLAIAAGTMMYVVLEEIFPKTRSMYSIIGFLVGMVIVNYI